MPDVKDREVSKGIIVNPGCLGGKPCIEGRRISAAMVADYANDGCADLLMDDYDISPQQIANARGWDRKGRPG